MPIALSHPLLKAVSPGLRFKPWVPGRIVLLLYALALALVSGTTWSDMSQQALAGYLPETALPDSLALLPPPPAPDSKAMAADEEAFQEARAYQGQARWAEAARDADLQSPVSLQGFACALDLPINDQEMPRLWTLLRRGMRDAGAATVKAKGHYQRLRPYVFHEQATCFPQDEERLRGQGSYPSGHTAIGWTWALILAELAPERTDQLLDEGYAFGQSRVICGYHWQSDVQAGYVLGGGVVSRLRSDSEFRAQFEAAKAEIAAARVAGLRPGHACSP